MADSLLGAKGSAPPEAAAAAEPAAPAASGNSSRVDGLLARVRGLTFVNGLRFKEDVIDVIDAAYDYTPTEYRTGFDTPWEVVNPAGKNEGSCKTFFFAQMHGLEPKARAVPCCGWCFSSFLCVLLPGYLRQRRSQHALVLCLDILCYRRLWRSSRSTLLRLRRRRRAAATRTSGAQRPGVASPGGLCLCIQPHSA